MAEDRQLKHCLALTALGLLVMQVWKVADLGELIWLASFSTWVAVFGASWRHNVTFSILTLLSAMCYMFGRFGGFEFGGWPIYMADAFGLGSLYVAGGPGVVVFIRNVRMGLSSRIRGGNVNFYSWPKVVHSLQKPDEIGPKGSQDAE